MRLPKLESALLIQRYKRFLADLELSDGSRLTVHCPNTGAMTGCAVPGSQVWYSTSDNPKRKYPNTLELVDTQAGIVSVNTSRANALVAEALAQSAMDPLAAYSTIKPEAKIPDESGRFDFLLTDPGLPVAYVEVKSVTLHQDSGNGAFPDAVSSRALKHVRALARRANAGERAVLLFCAQHCGIERVTPASAIDAEYANGLQEAAELGVEILAYGCTTDLNSFAIDRQLPFSFS